MYQASENSMNSNGPTNKPGNLSLTLETIQSTDSMSATQSSGYDVISHVSLQTEKEYVSPCLTTTPSNYYLI